uniref:X8 domain-containing protein n=1 Tax=Picea sitchensis TaxID=3332 RepID=A9NZF3_PICSI|nr:unknown [Picea sitchensis]
MAASIMAVALCGLVFLLLCGLSSCSAGFGKQKLYSGSRGNDTNLAAEEASFFLGNDSSTPTPSTPTSAGTTWCVAKNNVGDSTLQVALDYACGLGGADCTAIQQGGVCFDPDNVQAHASYAFNSYYVKNGMLPGTCDFAGSAAPTTNNPSFGKCMFETSTGSSSITSSTGGSITGAMGPSTFNPNGATFMVPPLLISTIIYISATVCNVWAY